MGDGIDSTDTLIWNFMLGSGRWEMTNFRVARRGEGVSVTTFDRMMDESGRWDNQP